MTPTRIPSPRLPTALILVAVAALTGCHHRADSAPKTTAAPTAPAPIESLDAYLNNGYTAIPLRRGRVSAELLADAVIDGKKVTLLVDTGCTASNLFSEAADRLGFVTRAGGKSLVGVNGMTKTDSTDFKTLVLGDTTLAKDGVLLVRKGKNLRYDGILGTDLLGGHGILIDLAEARLLIPKSPAHSRLTEAAGKTHAEVPLKRLHELLVLDAKVDGADARLVLDTGGQQSLLEKSVVPRANLTAHDAPAMVTNGTGGGSALRLVCPEVIALNGIELRRLPAFVADLPHLTDLGLDGMLSGDVLVIAGALIDPDGNRVFLAREARDLSDVGFFPGKLPVDFDAAQARAGHHRVLHGTLAGAKARPDLGDDTAAVAEMRYLVREIFADRSGAVKPGDTVTVLVSAPAGTDATRAARRYASAILLLDEAAATTPRPLDKTLMRAGPFRIEAMRAPAAP